jgi:chemotaxis protein methyltransferase CheR
VEEVVPLVVKGAGAQSRLTVWSAGCSTGEETYTLAMLLHDHPALRAWKVRIIGTDLCPSNIEPAERGVYRATALRSTNEKQKQKYFSEVERNEYRVNADLRRLVHFSVANLVDAADVRSVGRVDIIFCRNVLIYFDPKSRQTTTNLFYERLLPGGFLLLGHSESLLNTETRFEPVHLEGDLVYRRPLLESSSQSRIKKA